MPEPAIEPPNDSVQYEPCPFCGGTGSRPVPPPPSLPGVGNRPGEGRRHGYEATYMSGCHCDLCMAAHRVGVARRKAAKRGA